MIDRTVLHADKNDAFGDRPVSTGRYDFGIAMSTVENPYAVPDSRPRFDALTVYQESFFALIWPSVALSSLLLGLTLLADLVVPQLPGGRSFAIDPSPWALGLTLPTIALTAFFLTNRRLARSDGLQRSIGRSLVNAVGILLCSACAVVASVVMAGLVRELVFELNHINRTVINATVIPLTYSLLQSIIFKLCWKEIRLQRFALTLLGITVLIMLAVFVHPAIPELTKPIFLTFLNALVALLAHCTCFAWWYATPKVKSTGGVAELTSTRPADTVPAQL